MGAGQLYRDEQAGSGLVALLGLGGYWTVTRAMPPIPIALAAARVRSMQRPLINGPRSLIRTLTDRPLAVFVTVT